MAGLWPELEVLAGQAQGPAEPRTSGRLEASGFVRALKHHRLVVKSSSSPIDSYHPEPKIQEKRVRDWPEVDAGTEESGSKKIQVSLVPY